MRLKVLSAVLSATVVALVSGRVGASDAPQYRGGANHSGAAGESVTLTAATSLTQLYSINTGSSKVFADPVVSGDRLIIVNQGGDVLCLNAATGAPFWSKNAGEPIFATPAISNGRVFVGTEMGKLIAYDLESGAIAWQVSHGGQQLGAPAAAGGMIIVAAGFGNESLTAYSETTGTVVWTRALERFIQSPPAVYGDKVVYAMPDGSIMALQLSTGADAWTSKAQGQAIYFGIAPAIVADPDSSDVYIYAAPGDDVVGTGTNSITGFKKYATYKVKLSDGTLSKVVPGTVGTSAASTGRGTREPSAPTATASESGPADLRDCPPELMEELSRLNDLASQIKVIEEYEKVNGISMAAYKAELTAAHARMTAFKASKATAASGAASTRASSTGHATLQTSSFDTNWPTSGLIKPAPVAYLSHGTMRYMAVMMQEVPTISIAPRTLLFSINPAAGGELRWMYSTDAATVADRPIANGGALLVPSATDPNGAYILAGIGDAVGVFDASAGNTPLFQIDMQAPVYATPVLSNGKIFVVDSSGMLKAFSTPNAAPSTPLILSPAANADLQALASPTATWQPSTDDSTAQNALVYVIRSSINGVFAHDATDVVLSPNVTGYTWSGIEADSEITFAVRAVDSQEASGAWSATRTFYYKRDFTAPGAVTNLAVTPAAFALSVTFAASPDESPNGAKDVKNYRITVSEGAAALFTVDAGLSHTVVINGAAPATPLVPGHTYTVAVTAYDRRGNASPVSSVTASPVLDGPDITAPTVVSATLFDTDHNGWVETVEVTVSEKISTLAGDFIVSGFFLNGMSAVHGVVDNTKLTLSFGAGAEGTGPAQVTFDAAFGTIKDLSGNPLATFGPNDLAEIDAAPPVILGGSIQFHDDDNNGHPNRITADFSEAISVASVELADVAAVRDAAGTALIPLSATLLPNGVTLEITFDNLTGVMTGGDRPQLVLANNGNGTFFSDNTGNQFSGILLNQPPVVSVLPAFGNRAFNPGLITLDASASTDPDGPASGLTFEWRVTAFASAVPAQFYPSESGVLTGNKTVAGVARLLLTEPGLYSIVLNVTDAASNTESTTITFTVKNVAPRAVTIPEISAPVGSTAVKLDGRRSRDDNSRDGLTDLVSYSWESQSGPGSARPVLTDTTSAVATADMTGLAEGRHIFALTVRDRAGLLSAATVTVSLFSPANLPPVAVAGPNRRVAVLRPVILDGKFSRDDHPENLAYIWRVAEGSGLTLSGADTATATIIPTASGRSRIELVVNDGMFVSTDSFWLEVFDPAAKQYLPIAKATAPTRAAIATPFTVNAAGSTLVQPGPQPAAVPTMVFEQLSGPTLVEMPDDGALSKSFLALESGLVEYQVTASDGLNQSLPVHGSVLVGIAGAADPTLRVTAPAKATIGGAAATFDFSASTASSSNSASGTLAYSLVQTGGPTAASLAWTGASTVSFTPSFGGVYEFTLGGWDGNLEAAPVVFSVIVEGPGAHLPTAHPAVASVASNKRAATLSASSVSDADGDAVGFLWVQTVGPAAEITDPQSATTAVELPDADAAYEFELFVNDSTAQRSAGKVTVGTGSSTPATPGAAGGGGGCALISGAAAPAVWAIAAGALLAAIALLMLQRKRAAATVRSEDKRGE